MKAIVTLLFSMILAAPATAQDPDLRREATRLLERASAVSLSPDVPSLERVVNFRVLDASSTASEGTFTRVVIRGSGRRDEIKFGDYHLLEVYTRGVLARSQTSELMPAAPSNVMRLTPIMLFNFDDEDVIQNITDKKKGDRTLRCIEFDTTAGLKTDRNEFCVDPQSGVLVTARVGNESIENNDFFLFAGALVPGQIRDSLAGVPKLELSQTMTLLKDVTPDVLMAPPDAKYFKSCTTWRRAIGESTPQPKPGNGGLDYDLEVRGIIGEDGRIHEAVVESSPRPDLNDEALNLVKQWTFTPAMCNGHPNVVEADFVLHFRQR